MQLWRMCLTLTVIIHSSWYECVDNKTTRFTVFNDAVTVCKNTLLYLSPCCFSLYVGSYWGSISWRQSPKPPSRTSWRGGDVWSSRENRISPYHCCLNTQLVRTTQKMLPLMLTAPTGPSDTDSRTCSWSKPLNNVQITNNSLLACELCILSKIWIIQPVQHGLTLSFTAD